MKSQIELEATSGLQTSLERPLAGQSANVFNLSVDMDLPEIDGSVRVPNPGDRIVCGVARHAGHLRDRPGMLDAVFQKRSRLEPASRLRQPSRYPLRPREAGLAVRRSFSLSVSGGPLTAPRSSQVSPFRLAGTPHAQTGRRHPGVISTAVPR